MAFCNLKNVIKPIILFFMMCPRSIRGTSTPATKEYDPDKDLFDFYPHQNKKAPEQWLMDTNKGEREQAIRLEQNEPGFDLTDEEMDKFKIWPKGLIPYYIDDVSFDKMLHGRLRAFLDSVKALTGINFFELPTPPADEKTRWVFFINRRGVLECSDYTINDFTNEGVQKILVGYDCFIDLGRLSGTVLGLVGVPPMHNAPDRKKYIEVVDDHIQSDKKELFKVMDDKEWLFHDIAYDYSSAGHYHYHQYTATGNMTIKPKKDINYEVGQKTKLSFVDAWKIRMLYNYLFKKKGTKASVSACNKLFMPGEKFGIYEPDSDDELKPRVKPNKYLGIAKELQNPPTSAENNYNKNATNHDDTQNNKHNVTQDISAENDNGTKETAGGKIDHDTKTKENKDKDAEIKQKKSRYSNTSIAGSNAQMKSKY